MRRTLAVLCLSAVAALGVGCGGSDNTSNAGGSNNATRNGVVDTNSNMSSKPTGNPSNTATVVNNNGNDNTAGVKPMNGNAGNGNANKGNGNANH